MILAQNRSPSKFQSSKGDKVTACVDAFTESFADCWAYVVLDQVTPFPNQKEFLEYLEY